MSQSGNLCSFPLSLCVSGRDLEGGGERMHVLKGHYIYYHLTVLCRHRQCVTPGQCPCDTSLVQEHLGPSLEWGEFANHEVLVPWEVQCPSWFPSSPGC